jgi:hypothetical protein
MFAIMIVEKIEHNESDGTLGWIECVYHSSNIMLTIYFLESKVLYISFNDGATYKYSGVERETYDELETAESQGKYFYKNIRSGDYPFSREYKLYKREINEAKTKIEEWKEKNLQ